MYQIFHILCHMANGRHESVCAAVTSIQSSLIKAVNPWKTKKEKKSDNILISLLR